MTRAATRRLWCAIGAALTTAACGGGAGSRPADFAVTYTYDRGPVAPPGHYEETITFGPDAAGSYTLANGYDDAPEAQWRHELQITSAQLDELYALMLKTRVFRRKWREVREGDERIGGDAAWLDIIADGRRYEVPSSPRSWADRFAKQRIEKRVRELVPAAVTAESKLQRERYTAEQPERPR